MRLALYSDLHLEFRDWTPPPLAADLVLLAGDIHVGAAACEWARRTFDGPVVYVAGNHEFYGRTLPAGVDQLREAAERFDVRFLHEDAWCWQGLRFVGVTLWTDFAFYGPAPAQVQRSMDIARRCMRDYDLIEREPGVALTPEHTRELHTAQREWLRRELAAGDDVPTVVITHHLPHPGSVHPRYEGDGTNPAFVSDLSELFDDSIRLWLHGHTHESCDYRVGATRVVCNPRGYLPYQPNPAFDPALVVTIP